MTAGGIGDRDGFRELVEPYRRELLVHCYRMLGSLPDAEDALQDTLLAAWRGLGGFEGRASLRTWLYRIATNRCLDARRAAGRRPAAEWNIPGVDPPEPTRLGEVTWLGPFPDALLDGDPGPEARYTQAESISLAFVTALQALPPRQLAVLVLRDVLGFPAREVADMLDVTVASVHSALKRARTGLHQAGPPPAVAGPSPDEAAIVARFVAAYEAADLDALVALLTDDAFIAMPPIPFEYEGRDVVAGFFARLFGAGRRFDLVPTRANGQPAFGAYLRGPAGVPGPAGTPAPGPGPAGTPAPGLAPGGGVPVAGLAPGGGVPVAGLAPGRGVPVAGLDPGRGGPAPDPGRGRAGIGLVVVTLAGDRIGALTRFDPDVLSSFGLPRTLPGG